MKSILKKGLIALLAAVMLLGTMTMVACDDGVDIEGATQLSFKAGSSYEYLKSLNGKKVYINGYIGSSSALDGSSLFLMNLPNQSCPFCKPNTQELANTMEVYPKSGKQFDRDYDTARVVRVVGTLVVADEGEFFTDTWGYEFSFKIVDAEYAYLKQSELTESMQLAKSITDTGLDTLIYSMFDYVHFTCCWNTYFAGGKTSEGTYTYYYLYPSDALGYITTKDAQWNYGYADGYFDNLIKKVRAIDAEKLEDLVKIIEDAQQLSQRALTELNDGKYSSEYKEFTIESKEYTGKDYIYTLDNGDELYAEWEQLYYAWQGYFEL